MPTINSHQSERAVPFDWHSKLCDIVLDREAGTLLHAQLRTSLRRLVEIAPDNAPKLPPESELVKLLNVAPSTVRKALDGLVTEGLIERRRALGTVIKPRRPAESLKTLAVIMPNYPSHSISAHIAALNRQMGMLGGKMLIIPLNRGDDWKSCHAQLDFPASDGGVLFFNNIPDATVIDLNSALRQQGYRTVHLGRPPEGCPCGSVCISAEALVRVGVERLVAAGHRKITFLVGEPEENRDVRARVDAFENITASLGLPASNVLHCGIHAWESSSEAANMAIDTLWNRPVSARPTAIFAISDTTAIGAFMGLSRHGIRVPDDVSLLSSDGSELTRMTSPPLDSLLIPVDKFAVAITGALSDRHAGNQKILIEPDYKEGKSIMKIN
ncbi:MAG: substrate-binding domain-containing protein [Verrucomicrobiota bacterium]